MSTLNSNLLKKIDHCFYVWAKKNIIIHESGAIRINYEGLRNIFDESALFAVRIVGKIIQTVGGNEYAPKRKKTFYLISSLFIKKFKNKSLGNVNVSLSQGYIFFIREKRNLNFELNIQKNKTYIFDGRFIVNSSYEGRFVKSKNSNLLVIDNKSPFYKYRDWINNTIPCLETLEGKTIKPYLNIIYGNTTLNNFKYKCFNLYFISRFLM